MLPTMVLTNRFKGSGKQPSQLKKFPRMYEFNLIIIFYAINTSAIYKNAAQS